MSYRKPAFKLHNDNMSVDGWLNKHHLILIMIFLLVLTGLIIGLYVKVFTQKTNKHLLYLGSNNGHSALSTSSEFVNLATYFSGYHSKDNPYNGVFTLQMTNSSGIDLRVVDSGGTPISDSNGPVLSTQKGGISSITFSSEGGDVILQYKNSASDNYLLRLEVEPS